MSSTEKKAEEPPASIKQVVEKTVEYVRKNGSSFEDKLRLNDGNGQFEFLSPGHQYNLYYVEKLKAATDSKTSESANTLPEDHQQQENAKKPDELLFLTNVPPISNHDLDIIKATAAYVACNSSKHQDALQKLMERKGRRNQFAFMNRTHTLHALFQTYVQQYRAIINKVNGSADLELTKLVDSYIATGATDFLQKSYERAAFDKRHKLKEKSREQDIKSRQIHYASIDWQDFAFVSKVNFDAIDEVSELAEPMLRESIVYRSLEAKTKDLEFTVSTAAGDRDAEKVITGSKGGAEEVGRLAPTLENVPKGMKIRAAGESRLKRKASEQVLPHAEQIRCPITGTLVSERDFDTHLKTLLRDPRYKEQQDNFMRKNFTYASNLTTDQVYDNIKRLVSKQNRSEEEEAANAKRINLGR